MVQYLEANHLGSWHTALNNHAFSRPNNYGGHTVHSLTACKSFTKPGTASNLWQCVLVLPDSFTPGDGMELRTCGEGGTRKEADECACRLAVARLLLQRPGKVVLRPADWKVWPETMLAGFPGGHGEHEALPVQVKERIVQLAAEAGSER